MERYKMRIFDNAVAGENMKNYYINGLKDFTNKKNKLK